MKKNVRISVLFAVLLGMSASLSAQVSHFLGAWAQGGEYTYRAILDRTAFDMKSSLGGGGGLGFVYELRAGDHFLLDAGVGANSAWTRFKVPDQQYVLHNMVDKNGEVFDYIYAVNHRRDAYWVTSVQVPLLVGGQWGRFYFLAGAKFDMALLTDVTMKADISTMGDYKQGKPLVHNIPAQGFKDDMPWEQKERLALKPNVTASLELGCRLGEIYKEKGFDVPSQKVQYRIAVFADYGLLDPHVATDKPLMHVPATYNTKAPLSGLEATDVMSSKEMTDMHAFFNTVMVGVKFTVLFQLPKSKSCVMCREQPFRSSHGILE